MEIKKKSKKEELIDELKIDKIPIYREDELEILQKTIGEGNFGNVSKARFIENGDIVVIKHFEVNKNITWETIKTNILKELKVVKSFVHDNVPRFYGVTFKTNNDDITFGLIYSFINGSNLRTFLDNKDPNQSFDRIKKIDILIKLTKIVVDLHNFGIIHRDIKPENIMIDESNNIYVLDFGISKISEHKTTDTGQSPCTLIYSPPEANSNSNSEVELDVESETKEIKDNYVISQKFDIWSLGCIIYEIFSGFKPWCKFTKDIHRVTLIMIKKQQHLLDDKSKSDFPYFPKTFNTDFPEVFKITSRCLIYNRENRFTSEELLKELRQLRATWTNNI